MKKKTTSFLIPPVSDEEESRRAFPSHFIEKFLIPFGAFLVGVLGLLMGYEKLPGWALWIAVVYLIVFIFVSLVHPAKRLLTWIQAKRKKRQLAKTFFPELEDTWREFTELTAGNRVNTILSFLQQINNWEEFKEKRIPLDTIHWIRTWLESIGTRLAARGMADFNSVAWDLSILVSQYHYICVHAQEHLEPIVRAGVIPDQRLRHFKQEWTLAREGHMHLVNKWQQVTKKINAVAGERICLDYYEPIKTFE